MISTNLEHSLILQSLENHQIQPTLFNLVRVLKLQGRRWDLATDALIKKEFSIRGNPKIFFKFEIKFKKTRLKYDSKICIILNIILIKSYSFYFII